MRGEEEFQSSTYRSPYGNGLYVLKLETNTGTSPASYGSNRYMDDHHHHHYYDDHNKTSPATLPPPPPVAYSISKTNNNNRQYSWAMNERESKRQRRVAKYNTYTIESKMKSSIRNSFRWFKSKLRG